MLTTNPEVMGTIPIQEKSLCDEYDHLFRGKLKNVWERRHLNAS